MLRTRRFLATPVALRQLALASLIANAVLVVTGGAVRLTGSGLGCPTWPECTAGSYVTTPKMGMHGVIEFGNRTLTLVVGALALACVAAVLAQPSRRRSLVRLSTLVLCGIPAQAVIGGLTVLTKLNPWVVALHFLASIAVIAAAYALWRRADEPDGAVRLTVPPPVRGLAWAVTVASVAVLVVGTVVTGSGPHAGDEHARRTGLDPGAVAQLHADLVFLLIGLSIGAWYALRAVGGSARVAGVLIAVELGQGVIGFVQYFTHLPILAVALHMAGSCAVWWATLALLYATRTRDVPVAEPGALTEPAALAAAR
ncbi:MAG TPA: COX15/CtaA family protein [Micromonosporaceae bacterium]